MRLTEYERRVISEQAHRLFGAGTRVLLFGSRVDDSARGGDIDLYVETNKRLANRAAAASRFAAELQLILGEQKIDVIVRDSATPVQAIHEKAQATGVVL